MEESKFQEFTRLSELFDLMAKELLANAHRFGTLSQEPPASNVKRESPNSAIRPELMEEWEIAKKFFDDLGSAHGRLQTISEGLANRFVEELLSKKKFDQGNSLAEEIENEYFDRVFSGSPELKSYAKRLLEVGATARMQALVRCLEVVGTQVDADKVINYVEDSFPLTVRPWSPRKQVAHSRRLPTAKKIVSIVDSRAPVDRLDGLKQTWLGGLYLRRLKRFAFARRIALWLWKKGYPFYVNKVAVLFTELESKKWRQLTSLGAFVTSNNLQISKLLGANQVQLRVPMVYPDTHTRLVQLTQDKYVFPEVFVAVVKQATVYGATNLVLLQDVAIHHDLYDFERDFTSEELHGRTQINPRSQKVRWLQHDALGRSIPKAATFVDASASNYAHWLTEVLPRIVLFRRQKNLRDIPIIVNDGLHDNIMESLAVSVGPDCEIITLSAGRALIVEELYVTSAVGYVPFDRRTNKIGGHSHGKFSPMALEMLRKDMSSLASEHSEGFWPEKIFLRRNSHARRITNESEIEALVIAQGFSVVEPEKLNFSQQTKLFSNARLILGSAGAALANSIFCAPGAQVGILSSKHQSMSYGYWSAILDPLEVKISYILGDIVRNHEFGVHGDFEIDSRLIMDFLNNASRELMP